MNKTPDISHLFIADCHGDLSPPHSSPPVPVKLFDPSSLEQSKYSKISGAHIQKRAWSTHSRVIIHPKTEQVHLCVHLLLCNFYFFCDYILAQCQFPEWPLTFCGSATHPRSVEQEHKMWQQKIRDGRQSTSPRWRSSSIQGGITKKEKQEKIWESQTENNVRASCRKNAAVKKCKRTEQRPQRPVWKGQLDPEQPSASAWPRKQRRIARLHPWSKSRRVERAREGERERGKLGAGCQELCKSAKPRWGYVSGETNPALTKDTHLWIASPASDTRLSKPAERDKSLKWVKYLCKCPLINRTCPDFPARILNNLPLKLCFSFSSIPNPLCTEVCRSLQASGESWACHRAELSWSNTDISHCPCRLSTHMWICNLPWCTRMPFSSPKMCYSPPHSVLNHAKRVGGKRQRFWGTKHF